jgi:hypothetical protein
MPKKKKKMTERCFCRYEDCVTIRQEVAEIPEYAHLAGCTKISRGSISYYALLKTEILASQFHNYSVVYIAYWHYNTMCFSNKKLTTTCKGDSDPDATGKFSIFYFEEQKKRTSDENLGSLRIRKTNKDDTHISAPCMNPGSIQQIITQYKRIRLEQGRKVLHMAKA